MPSDVNINEHVTTEPLCHLVFPKISNKIPKIRRQKGAEVSPIYLMFVLYIQREILYFTPLSTDEYQFICLVFCFLVTVLLIHNSDAWRRRRRFRYRIRRTKIVRPPPPPSCVGSDICVGSCLNGKCTWHCANTCDVMVNGEVM